MYNKSYYERCVEIPIDVYHGLMSEFTVFTIPLIDEFSARTSMKLRTLCREYLKDLDDKLSNSNRNELYTVFRSDNIDHLMAYKPVVYDDENIATYDKDTFIHTVGVDIYTKTIVVIRTRFEFTTKLYYAKIQVFQIKDSE